MGFQGIVLGTAGAPVVRAASTEADLDRVFAALRPKLHRYCARMTGSVIDGEDVVQETLVKAMEARRRVGTIAVPEAWLFRIAHNAALDFLRRRARSAALHVAFPDEADAEALADPADRTGDRAVVAASLAAFMRLSVAQRGSVILADVLGYSLKETAAVLETSPTAVKAVLARGRARLRRLADEPEDLVSPVLSGDQRRLLAFYVERFNARDFDAIRDRLADEVELDLVNRKRLNGRSDVAGYFSNYARIDAWLVSAGFVDGQPCLLVSDPADATATPLYPVLLGWAGDRIVRIRDFRYARYVMDGVMRDVMGGLAPARAPIRPPSGA
ncbi:sigma-70 family RNA polymerase sigma factor [Phreatobacter stygius]|uniref:Sigma-70 family RNA polymerase sigma factor n=1 Tax=Phreatobacter stygius TaxID=1940610 RepID=A0A4D7BD16_9HYPH|nr:sigma-70 family RNA polymerase sigma factor [Phreatobacter stygius]QCI67266.1 sigma-70 family RNA polymerase sigma factor [Phreatobacter stygius]